MPTPHYGQPRYRAIADELRERMENGAIPAGTLLPPESTLSAEFRAARGTIRQAIAVLREAGLVATEHGRGTYSTTFRHRSKPDNNPQPEVRERPVAADPELAAVFGVQVGAALIEAESVTRRGEQVETVVRTYRLAVIKHAGF